MSNGLSSTQLTLKEASELYENGKHRRYSLLFSVNGGAFAIAKLVCGEFLLRRQRVTGITHDNEISTGIG
jgi:hypothetical protein